MDFTFIDQLCEEFIERGAFPSVVVPCIVKVTVLMILMENCIL